MGFKIFQMNICFLLLPVLLFTACNTNSSANQTKKKPPQVNATVQTEVQNLQYENLLEKIQQNDDVLYVVNFWATWCVPCVEELPEFLEVNRENRDNPNFKMYLVSLDMPMKKESLLKYMKEKNIDAEVLLLDDAKRQNTWIPIINPDWSGSLPATAMYKNGEQVYFTEGTMDKKNLNIRINQNITQ